jgi:hypothetical protein
VWYRTRRRRDSTRPRPFRKQGEGRGIERPSRGTRRAEEAEPNRAAPWQQGGCIPVPWLYTVLPAAQRLAARGAGRSRQSDRPDSRPMLSGWARLDLKGTDVIFSFPFHFRLTLVTITSYDLPHSSSCHARRVFPLAKFKTLIPMNAFYVSEVLDVLRQCICLHWRLDKLRRNRKPYNRPLRFLEGLGF